MPQATATSGSYKPAAFSLPHLRTLFTHAPLLTQALIHSKLRQERLWEALTALHSLIRNKAARKACNFVDCGELIAAFSWPEQGPGRAAFWSEIEREMGAGASASATSTQKGARR